MVSQSEPAASRTRRPRHGRRNVAGALGLTLLGALLPGSGYLAAGRRKLGAFVLILFLALAGAAAYVAATRRQMILRLAVDPNQLLIATVALGVLGLVWVVIIVTQHRMLRPGGRGGRVAGSVFVGLLCFAVAAPLALAAQAALTQRDLVQSVFASGDSKSATRPTVVDKEDPWAAKPRLNILLLGADDGPGRQGVRVDTVIVASIDTKTGDTALISLPRKLLFMPFPADSPLHDVYPNGFGREGLSLKDRLEWMLDAMYKNIPDQHPGILGPSDNEGADVLKVSVGEATGLDIDYYVQVNLAGFTALVDALGGITVNINYPIPVGGSDDARRPPSYYLQPGPNQHLMGLEALWYARGRYRIPNPDDARQARQRCAINAIAERANPSTLVTSYQQLAAAGKNMLRTDIPQNLLPAFVDLGLKVKTARVSEVPLDGKKLRFAYAHPDYDGLRKVVATALEPKATTPPTTSPPTPPKTKTVKAGGTEDLRSACEYRPEQQ
jgi:LCP family protein required for cell wall assembly